jgi:hypothetical protein
MYSAEPKALSRKCLPDTLGGRCGQEFLRQGRDGPVAAMATLAKNDGS